MKFTLSWLKDHLDTETSVDAIAEALTDLGLEVEGVEDPTAALGPFRICRVIEAVQHPNADRLRVCRVETYPEGPGGRAEEVQVVCGAPNAKTGLVGVFAPPGTHVPGTGVAVTGFSLPRPRAARSRAMPWMPRASGRFGVTLISMTGSLRPR